MATGCCCLGDTTSHELLKDARSIRDSAPVPAPVSRELSKELLPPHQVQPGDTLLVQAIEADSPIRLPPDEPVQANGTIDLGKYGRPLVAGKTLPQVEAQVRDLIKEQEKQGGGVTVRLVGKPSSLYYVFGEVKTQGSFPITARDGDGCDRGRGRTEPESVGREHHPVAPDRTRQLPHRPAGLLAANCAIGGHDHQLPAPARRPRSMYQARGVCATRFS